MVKKNAPELLEKFFQKRNYIPKTIMLSGNTDCYQPIERELEITQKILEVCWHTDILFRFCLKRFGSSRFRFIY